MKREEKNMLTRAKIQKGALAEFSRNGYIGASVNNICSEADISKGIIYHYYRDKDELYIACVRQCFEQLTEYLEAMMKIRTGSQDQQLETYFDARAEFFWKNPVYLPIFIESIFNPSILLLPEIEVCRKEFREQSVRFLTEILGNCRLRAGNSLQEVIEDFTMYMDFFNARFKLLLQNGAAEPAVFERHERECHRQLDILLHGILENGL